MANINISDYINSYYREYSIYTNNNRAIPSIIDGFKPVQRKVIYCADKEVRSSFKKVSSVAGLLPNIAAYHHGDASGQDAIVKMTQDFSKNLPLMQGSGTFGSRLVPIAGAPRYIYSKLHKNFDLVFKDNDIVPQSLDKDDHPEPLYYLPLIPMVLVNGVSGVAVGFSTNILPRCPKKITTACINYIEKGTIRAVNPSLKDFKGQFEKIKENKFLCRGIIDHVKSNQYKITELPLGTSHESYIEHLDNLKEKGILTRYIDNSDDSYNIDIFLTLEYQNNVSDEKLDKDFKISKSLTENIFVLEDFNITQSSNDLRIVKYDNEKQIIEKFCDFRMKYYTKRIQANIDRLTKETNELEQKIKFINEVIKGTIKVGKLSKKELIDELINKQYDKDIIDKLINIAIYLMTKDNVERMKAQLQDKKDEMKEWKKSNEKDLYLSDLKELHKKL